MVPPDTDSQWEMWLVFQIVAGVRNPWILFVLFLLAISYAVCKLVAITVTRLVEIFKERATAGKPRAPLLRAALGCLGASWVVAALLYANEAAWEVRHAVALDLFACATFLFIVVCVALDWIEERRERTAQPALPEHLSIGDVISWRSQVGTADREANGEER